MTKAIVKCLDENKAEDIVAISLKGKANFCDMMIIATGRVQRHVAALADHVAEMLRERGMKDIHIEGQANSDWVLIDAGDVIIHLFRPEVRSFYRLEQLWAPDVSGAGQAH